ncbi:MAG: TIR domain-containing protein [Chthoniobacterales bacterium]
MKAFLSHSSENKDFVETVATQLGRQFCVFDKQSFQSGIEFKDSIEKGLDDSTLFVLFASPEALKSIWVQFEITEAFYSVVHKRLNRVLVVMLGDSVQVSQLPEWLRRAKVIVVSSPKQTAREIRLHLNELLRVEKHSLFIGRTREIAQAEQELLNTQSGIPRRFLAFVGLPQIGRRSIARRVAQNVLGMPTTTEVTIESGDDLRDIAFKLAIESEPYAGTTSLAAIQDEIASLSDDEAASRALRNLRAIVATGSLPMFVDAGGLLNENGDFAESLEPFFHLISGASDVYLFFITSRKLTRSEPLTVSIVRIPSLPEAEVYRLLQALSARINILLSQTQLTAIAGHASGYPPACYFAIQLIKEYGVATILANSSELVDFRIATFVAYVTKHALSKQENELLRLLANFSPLPLPVIGGHCGLDAEAVSVAIVKLIDFSMISPDLSALYAISDPLRDAIFKHSRYFQTSETKKIAVALHIWLDQNDEEQVSLPFSRVIYRVARHANDAALAEKVVHLTADIFRLAEQAYNQQDYVIAVEGFRKVLELRPDLERATVLLVRALAQLDEWGECDSLCSAMEGRKMPTRTTQFLRGFVARKRSYFSKAISHFELARKAGRNDVAVLRELASCYLISGDSRNADECLKEAFDLQPDNPYLIDMAVKVAMQLDDLKTAGQQLERLRIFDTGQFYWHRMATYYVATDDIPAAIDAGMRSVSGEARPRYEALSHLAYCEIRGGKIDEARAHLAEIDKLFPRLRTNITFALQCQLELKSGNLEEVLRRIDQASSKTNRFLAALRFGAIRRILTNPGLTDKRRLELQAEIKAAPTVLDEPAFGDLPR